MITLVPSAVTEEVINLAQLVYPEVTMSTRIIDIAFPGVSITHGGETADATDLKSVLVRGVGSSPTWSTLLLVSLLEWLNSDIGLITKRLTKP